MEGVHQFDKGFQQQEYPSQYPPQYLPTQGYPTPANAYPGYAAYPPNYSSQQPRGYPTQPIGFTNEEPPDYSQFQPQAPPPYFESPQQPVQTQHNVMIVTQQQPTIVAPSVTRRTSSDNYLIITIIVMVVCTVLGTCLTLFCTIPALLSSLQAKEAERQGHTLIALYKNRRTISLNVSAIVFGFVLFVVIVSNVGWRVAVY
jgi:hypothetical protein